MFQNYLSNRKQSVFCNNNYSNFNSIPKGVPQGSVLGPILFLVYINDIINSSTRLKFLIYADDTTLLLKDKNIVSLHANLNLELDQIKTWVQSNKLILNITKTNYILFQNRSIKKSIPPIMLNGEILKKVNQTQFLGVIIDENLNWKSHIDHISLKISKVTGILYRVRHNLTSDALLSIYYTLCYPHFTYCVAIWASTWPSFLNKLTVAQNKIIRCICFLKKFESTTKFFSELRILRFLFIHQYFTLLLIYRNITNNKIFKLVEHVTHTRSNNTNLICPQFRTSLFKNIVINFAPKLFNSLPNNKKGFLKNSSIYVYKKEIKEHLLSKQLVSG